jgi:hypothetical protein
LLPECNDAITRVVFMGPSLSPEAVGAVPADVSLLPPIKRGDVDYAVQRFPNLKTIGIVDGEFFQSFAVSPKEILRSMDHGKRFFGSSSMGALRATELTIYGMAGVGKVYQMFFSGEIDADDEVAMTFDPVTLRPTSEPLANIRIALERSCHQGELSHSVMEKAIRIAKDLYYPDRTYGAMLAYARNTLSDGEFHQLKNVCQTPSNAKSEDAWQLLNAMGIVAEGRPA